MSEAIDVLKMQEAMQREGVQPITVDEIRQLFDCVFPELIFHAHRVHIQNFDAGVIQLATLLSIKTGGCPEDCGYCSQSTHADSGIKASRLMDADAVLAAAQIARDRGATRFCMGAAWRNPKDRDMDRLCEMVRGVKAMGLETCMTLGMLSEKQSEQLADAGLDYYNHNLDSSRDFYGRVVTSRSYDDRLSTLARVRKAGMSLCCGGILGMGESRNDRAELIHELARMDPAPESVPINALVPVKGTVLGDQSAAGQLQDIDPLEFVRTVAVARIAMPRSVIRLSAGREAMSDELQALCFMAGANSIFSGDVLLTAPNGSADRDRRLFDRLGLRAAPQGIQPGAA